MPPPPSPRRVLRRPECWPLYEYVDGAAKGGVARLSSPYIFCFVGPDSDAKASPIALMYPILIAKDWLISDLLDSGVLGLLQSLTEPKAAALQDYVLACPPPAGPDTPDTIRACISQFFAPPAAPPLRRPPPALYPGPPPDPGPPGLPGSPLGPPPPYTETPYDVVFPPPPRAPPPPAPAPAPPRAPAYAPDAGPAFPAYPAPGAPYRAPDAVFGGAPGFEAGPAAYEGYAQIPPAPGFRPYPGQAPAAPFGKGGGRGGGKGGYKGHGKGKGLS